VCETPGVEAIRDPAAELEAVDVVAADGTADALLARPVAGGPHPGVVLFMDAYGIRPALEAHVRRLAAAGYCVLAPNVFYRHGRSPVAENLEELMAGTDREALWAVLRPKMATLTPAAARADGEAWLGFLADRPEARPGPVGTVGYCMGGRLALRLAGDFAARVAAAASFHGGGLATEDDDSPHLTAIAATAELYVGHADNDRSMDPAQMGRLARALAEAHVRHTAELYVGAGHGWTQTDSQVYEPEAAERHWMRLLELFGRVLGR
jgi:carboxymethylenebutenolidase